MIKKVKVTIFLIVSVSLFMGHSSHANESSKAIQSQIIKADKSHHEIVSTQDSGVANSDGYSVISKYIFVKPLAGLVVILVMIFGLAWVVKKFNINRYGVDQNIKILSSFPLGDKEKIMVMEIYGQRMILGVTSNVINKISDIEVPFPDKSRSQTSQDLSLNDANTLVDQLSVKQKMNVLKQVALSKNKENQDNQNNTKSSLSAKNVSDFSQKLKDFIAGGRNPGCD